MTQTIFLVCKSYSDYDDYFFENIAATYDKEAAKRLIDKLVREQEEHLAWVDKLTAFMKKVEVSLGKPQITQKEAGSWMSQLKEWVENVYRPELEKFMAENGKELTEEFEWHKVITYPERREYDFHMEEIPVLQSSIS